MPDTRAPLAHLLRGAEEILRGVADAMALARGRIEAADVDPVASALARVVSWLGDDPSGLVGDLRDALRAEHARWELRAADDDAARRVADLLAALREFVDPEPPPPAEVLRSPGARVWRERRRARDAR